MDENVCCVDGDAMTKKQCELIRKLKLGELLDEWEQLPNDIKYLEELEKLNELINYVLCVLEKD